MTTAVVALRTAFNAGNANEAKAQINNLKLHFAMSPPNSQQEVATIIEMLEISAMLSLRNRDLIGFEREAAQAKAYYSADGTVTERASIVLGLYLLHLLTQDRIGDFHTELELIPHKLHSSPSVAYAVSAERAMMEGNYSKALNSSNLPVPEFAVFVGPLSDALKIKKEHTFSVACAPVSRKTGVSDALEGIEKLLSYAGDLERIV